MSTIAERARFDTIRYAQAWEDADVLLGALKPVAGQRLLAICASGDNALALLLTDPREVVAVDLSLAQIACLKLRLAAYRTLQHDEFLELFGARPSTRRQALLDRVLDSCDAETSGFWRAQSAKVVEFGAGNIGKFESYFRRFRRTILPLIHSRAVIDDVFTPRDRQQRERFFDERWNTVRWRLATRLFFSRTVMGWLGRDPAFFDHVEGSAGAHVRAKVRFAAVEQDPSRNSYMRHILTGGYGDALPTAWRAESYATIAARLDRITVMAGPIDAVAAGPFDGFYLSDIFEYMSPDEASAVYARLLALAAPGARLVYWNMMAPRSAPPSLAHRVERLGDLEARLKRDDKAFFYSDLVIEEVRP